MVPKTSRLLQFLFNMSLSSRFPTRWKLSYITPVFKAGVKPNIENYRGIAILPTIGKLFECIVSGILFDRLKGIISVNQHGFMKKRSTTTNLVEFVNEAISVIEAGSQVDAIYTAVSKAFDRISHSLLIQKLKELGIHSTLLNWIDSYIRGGFQYV